MGFDPEKITFFAKTDARGQQVPFGIKAKDRQRHMYVVGKTGMGKSTLLENMAVQDIKNGEGMAFIDPHGSAAETLLEYIPENRINDVIYFAPFDLNNPISFNVMEDVGPDRRHLVVSGLMSTFKKIWVDAWSARMEYILTNALLALIEYPDTTLLSVNRLFSDKAYRNLVVDYIKDPAVKSFWVDEFAGYTERFVAEALPAIQNKIGQFTGNPLIRNIIGQPHSSFDLRKVMDEKKILIINLSKGLIGETNANLLGSMLTTRIYLAAMSRADLSVEEMRQMPNFYFYVDEFQSFANATFANILSEARKYHLNLIIAHQYIEQMEEEVKNAVFGNVGTTVTFRVGPFDAEVLETVFAPQFEASDLVNLGFAQIYLTLMIDGIGSQPFSAITLPPIERPRVSFKEVAINSSRRNYTKKREEVEELVVALHTPTKTANKIEHQKRMDNNQSKNQNQNRNYTENKPRRENQRSNENNFERNSEKRKFNSERENFNKEKKAIFSKDLESDFQKPKINEGEKVVKKEEKSLADLRNILSKITSDEKENEDKKNNFKDTKKYPEEKTKGRPEDKNNSPEKPNTKIADSKSELRNLLANLKPEEKIEKSEESKAEENILANESFKKEKSVTDNNPKRGDFQQINNVNIPKQKSAFDFQKQQEKIRRERAEKIQREKEELERLKIEQLKKEKEELERKLARQKEKEEMRDLSDEIDSFLLELERWGGAKKQIENISPNVNLINTEVPPLPDMENKTDSSFKNQNQVQNQNLKPKINNTETNIFESDKIHKIEFTPQSVLINQKISAEDNKQTFSNKEIEKRLKQPKGEKSPFIP